MSSPQKSTTVRAKSHAGARAALRALQSIAPPLAARVAARVFMTPPRNGKAPPLDWATLGHAAPFAVEAGGETLRGVRVGRGPAVLLVHGWGGRANQLAIERRVGIRMSELVVPRLAAGLSTPALVVHDRADAEVPWNDGAAIATAWPGARLVATEGLGHRRILRDRHVVSGAASFVIDRLTRCGCGRLASCVHDGIPRCETCLLALHLQDREGRSVRGAA
jgi:pimeloyl-ACP methyl ester carboxylesterase